MFKGLGGKVESGNVWADFCVGAVPSANRARCVMAGMLEFGFRVSESWADFGERAGSPGKLSGDSCLILCLLSVRPTSDGSL